MNSVLVLWLFDSLSYHILHNILNHLVQGRGIKARHFLSFENRGRKGVSAQKVEEFGLDLKFFAKCSLK